MKVTSTRAPSAMMSVQEMWLAAISSGRVSTILPTTFTRMPSAASMARCQIFSITVSGHRPVFIETSCSGTSTTDAAM